MAGDRVVLTFQWRDPPSGLLRSETFGPWETADDLAHMGAIRDFIADWARLTGLNADVVTIAVAFDPAAWVREHEGADRR